MAYRKCEGKILETLEKTCAYNGPLRAFCTLSDRFDIRERSRIHETTLTHAHWIKRSLPNGQHDSNQSQPSSTIPIHVLGQRCDMDGDTSWHHSGRSYILCSNRMAKQQEVKVFGL